MLPHPYWHHYYRRSYNMFYGPSRLVWFAFGSAATWAWIRHHENNPHYQGTSFCRPRVAGYRDRSHWERDDDQAPPNPNPNASSPGSGSDYGQWRPTQPQPRSQSMPPMPTDRDHEHMRQIGRNAEETISGMSEATIDSMMGALQRLKDRLAERRGQQQLQEIQVGSQQVNPTPTPATPEGSPHPRHWV